MTAAPAPGTVPLRLLTTVPICDGHDSAINTINLELIRHGVEVIYLGYHRAARDVARAAVQEDVRAVGISSYNGGHAEFFADVWTQLRGFGVDRMGLFGGGGGTITREDVAAMQAAGHVDRIFFAGESLDETLGWITRTYGAPAPADPAGETPSPPPSSPAVPGPPTHRDLALARRLTAAETACARPVADPLAEAADPPPPTRCRVVGITGPGGAGKTTLIDELVLRFLRERPPTARLAILSHDPSIVGAGALLGDRATMVYSQHDRVFLRSLATRGQAGGLSPATGRCLRILAESGEFELVIIETVGTGQEAMPFGGSLVDQKILVMNPDYGSRLQLQKIAMLDLADLVVANKSDLQGAKTASAELERRLGANRRGQRLIVTQATRHRDEGVDQVYREVFPAAPDPARSARRTET